jgi:hypothetical protein
MEAMVSVRLSLHNSERFSVRQMSSVIIWPSLSVRGS